MHICVYVGDFGGQRHLIPLDLELQVIDGNSDGLQEQYHSAKPSFQP